MSFTITLHNSARGSTFLLIIDMLQSVLTNLLKNDNLFFVLEDMVWGVFKGQKFEQWHCNFDEKFIYCNPVI